MSVTQNNFIAKYLQGPVLSALKYLGIHGEMNSTKGLLTGEGYKVET